MKTPEQKNEELETPLIGRLIDVRLKARLQAVSVSPTSGPHPDEDVISAFVEGRVEGAESFSIISHLVNCATCLHLTADLIRFEPDMNEVGSASLPEPDPSSLRKLLDRIAGGAIPSGENAVFAYQESDDSATDDDPEQKEPESQTAT